jgi:uncharacterized damage-inducible protein DinB
MKNPIFSSPAEDEYFHYYGKYVALVEGADILASLEKQIAETQTILETISEEKAAFRYAEDKWSIKELVGHIIDSERIFAYRALRIARGDETPIEGFEQDDYVKNGNFDDCRLENLAAEFAIVRQSTRLLLKNLTAEAWTRRGTASDKPVSVRALAYIIAGHEIHHINILKERYL